MIGSRKVQVYVPTPATYEALKDGNRALSNINIMPDGQIGFEDCDMDDINYGIARHPSPVKRISVPHASLAPHIAQLTYKDAYDPNEDRSIRYLNGIDVHLEQLHKRSDLQNDLSNLTHKAITEALLSNEELEVTLDVPYKTVERWNRIYTAAINTTALLLAKDN